MPSSPDPRFVRLSITSYRLLLGFFPARFRFEYSPHMIQVFRDSCLDTYRRTGSPGLIPLWAHALFDWFKIMIEERFQQGTDMTQSKFIRASGWGLVLAAVALLLTFISEGDLQAWFTRIFGPPTTFSGLNRLQTVTGAVAESTSFFTILLITLGLVGLHLRFGERAGEAARTSLVVGVLGGVAGLVFDIGMTMGLEQRPMVNICVAIMFAGLVGFGLAALRSKAMPRGNGLPVLAGVWWPLLVIDAYVFPLGLSRLGPEVPLWFSVSIFLLIGVSLAALGFVLQSDAPRSTAVV